MFKTENCLVATSIPQCRTLASRAKPIEDGVLVLQEVNMGFGIADIVVVQLDLKSDKREKESQFLSRVDVTLYKLIEKEIQISPSLMEERTRLSKRAVKSSLDKLCCLEFISFNDNGEAFVLNKYETSISQSIAIEVKLKDWRRALNQAYRYKWFATESYVLLDEAKSGPAKKNICEFVKIGVGLLTVDLSGSMEIVYDPGISSPIDNRMAMLLNEKVLEHSFSAQ